MTGRRRSCRRVQVFCPLNARNIRVRSCRLSLTLPSCCQDSLAPTPSSSSITFSYFDLKPPTHTRQFDCQCSRCLASRDSRASRKSRVPTTTRIRLRRWEHLSDRSPSMKFPLILERLPREQLKAVWCSSRSERGWRGSRGGRDSRRRSRELALG